MKLSKLLEQPSCSLSIGMDYYPAESFNKNQFSKLFNKNMNKIGKKEDGITFYRSSCGRIELSIIS